MISLIFYVNIYPWVFRSHDERAKHININMGGAINFFLVWSIIFLFIYGVVGIGQANIIWNRVG